MTYLHLDDNFAQHPKIAGLSDAALRLHIAGLCYCARNLTDGIIPGAIVQSLTPHYRKAPLIAELTGGRIWVETGPTFGRNFYEVHDFLDWNDSRNTVLQRIENARKAARTRWNGRPP